jgi:uncharacterized membrane protein
MAWAQKRFSGLILLAVPFVLPIVSLVRLSRANPRVRELAEALAEQQRTIDKLARQMAELRQTVRAATPPAPSRPFEPSPLTTPSFSMPEFDWENLIGVTSFSGIAGVALVIAAVFCLKYSIDHGWLQPPAAIGILVSIALLVVCELKVARQYRVTANALDAAAIAILFATFFCGQRPLAFDSGQCLVCVDGVSHRGFCAFRSRSSDYAD